MSEPETLNQRWRYALKPASWQKLVVPALLGQALGYSSVDSFSVGALVFGAAFAALDIAFIVLLNDWADRDVDALKRRMFPHGGGPKTIPDGILPARQVLLGGLLAGLGALAVAGASAAVLDRPLLLPGAVLALALFIVYSLPPLRLNYRGGGELLEALGVGVLLPWLNAHAHSGRLWAEGWGAVLAGFCALALASAIASGLSDEQSDRRGGKRTFTTAFGNPMARRVVESLMLAGIVVWGISVFFVELELKIALIFGASTLWDYRKKVCSLSTGAVTNAFPAQKRYKAQLHRGIWRSATAVATILAAMGWWWS